VPKADAAVSKADAAVPKAAPTTAPKADPKPAIAAASPAPAAIPAPAPTPATGMATTTTVAATPTASTSALSANAQGATPATPAKAEGFVVQLAAFADDKGANSLANKLKKNGYAAYVQPVETSRGTLWRVRVGGYATRPEAEAARATLKGEGYSGITAPAQ
jgi:DedD protein